MPPPDRHYREDEFDQLVKDGRETSVSPDWLAERAAAVRRHLGSAAHDIYQAGLELREVQGVLRYTRFVAWIHDNFPFSYKTAYQYIRISNFFEELDVPPTQIRQLVASTSVLDTLAGKDLPEATRAVMTRRLLQGQRLTVAMIKGAALEAERMARREEHLAGATERVAAMAEITDLDPDIIPILDEILSNDPDTFDAVEASGCIEDPNGEQIPLEEANARDVRDYVSHTRFERRMAGLARSGALALVITNYRPQTNAEVYSLMRETIIEQRFDTAEQLVVKAAEEQLGEVRAYEEMVDLVFTAYLDRYRNASELFIRGYESGLYAAGLLAGDGPFHINSVKVASRRVNNGDRPRLEINIYPRQERT